MALHTYLPQDRLRAIANYISLPDNTSGSALFADISGFTGLTESLREALGARQGAEVLSRQMGEVFSALVAEVEMYGGSVIDFAGDSMLCWFDRGNDELQASSSSALSAAMGIQNAIQAFPTLALKVSIASGPARRFVVGDENIQRLDVLAGATITRAAIGEHLATKGEVLVDEATAKLLGDSPSFKEWREDGSDRFAVVEKLSIVSKQSSVQIPGIAPLITDTSVLRPFIHHAVYEREISGQGSFLTEFRPCVALFIRFSGLDYEADGEETRLDEFVQSVQRVAERYHGILLQITIGDKGSYAYVNFGALSAHEDDTRRAVKTALELRNKTELQLQMGITQGVMHVGNYGGKTRKTFGATGDDVNLAARLMTTANVGEILLSSQLHKAVMDGFTFEPRPPLSMKGKAEPLPVFAVTGKSQMRAVRLQEPNYSLPMVGRQAELKLIEEKLDLTKEGKSQVIGIVAEAGLGKSRLVAEVIRNARRKGFVGFGGACQSDGIHTPYLAWKSIWEAFFDVDPEMSERKLLRNIEGEIEDRAPSRVDAMPLLNAVLDLKIPENDLTKNLEPKIRQSALHALLEDCLKAQVTAEPTLIVIEDLHWIDALSHDLLDGLAKALANYAVCFVLAYRPPQMERLQLPRIEALEQFTRIELHELTTVEAESAIRAKLLQLYPARGGALPAGLVDALMRRAQGNPFYLEELLNYVRDRGLDPADLQRIELPDSLHTLILSRIDQLSEHEKTTLRAASIVGRLFRAKWLMDYYPELGSFPQVKVALDALDKLDITPLDSPEPELAYLFKHIVTHEVTYESLPFATRAKLHEQLAKYLEGIGAAADTIAFHYGRSDNTAKKREYYQKAAEAAHAVSAYDTAIEYLTRLLDLTPASDPTRSGLALQLADSHYRLSDYPAARAAIGQAQAAATTDADRATALALLGETASAMGDYAEASTILIQAVSLARASRDRFALCRALRALGYVYWLVGKLDDARAAQEKSLALARDLGDVTGELIALNVLGLLYKQTDPSEAERLFTEVHTRAVAVGNREREMTALNNLGDVAFVRKDYTAAQDYFQQTIALAREIGAQDMIALVLNNLAVNDIQLGNLSSARAGLHEALALALRLGSMPEVMGAVCNFAEIAYAEGQNERALALLRLARHRPAWSSEHQREMDRMLAEWGLDPSVVESAMAKGAELDWDETIRELINSDY